MAKHPDMLRAIENAKTAATSNRGMYPYTVATNVFYTDGTPLEELESDSDEDNTDENEDSGDSGSGDSGSTGDESGDSGETGGDSGESGDSGDSGEDESGDSGDTDEDDNPGESEEDAELNADLPESSSYFSTTFSSEAAETAASVAEEAFTEELLDEDSTYGTYLGCYQVTADTDTLTLASPIEVDDPEVYTAIVLHYNEETGTWEQVSDVQIIDGYVYAVFTSLSPVAVYLLKKKYAATVTIGEEVMNYETIEDAVAYALESAASAPIVTLTWNKVITETLKLQTSSEGSLTLDLGGYTIYANISNGYAISVENEEYISKYSYIQNGSIICGDNTVGAISITNAGIKPENLVLNSSYEGGATVKTLSSLCYMTNCEITTANGTCVEADNTATSTRTCKLTSCTLTQTQTSENSGNSAAAYVGGDVGALTLNICGSTINSDAYGVYNGGSTSIVYVNTDSTINASTAVYINAANTKEKGLYTSSDDASVFNGSIVTESTLSNESVQLYNAILKEEPKEVWIASGYDATLNEDGTYTVAVGKFVEITAADGTVTYSNTLNTTAVKSADGGSLKLFHDMTVSTLSITKSLTLDLNGYTIETTGTYGLYTNADVSVTIKNGKIHSTNATSGSTAIHGIRGTTLVDGITIDTDYCMGIAVGNAYAASLTISNSTINSADCGIFLKNNTNGTVISELVVNENVTINSSTYAISGNGTYDNTNITINDGTFNAGGVYAALYHPQNGTMIINGGTFNGANGIQICDGTVTINNATVTATGADNSDNKTGDGSIPDGAAISVVDRSGYSDTYPSVTINGGTFTTTSGVAPVKAYSWSGSAPSTTWETAGEYVKIMGGNFSESFDTTLIPDGYQLNESESGYSVGVSA